MKTDQIMPQGSRPRSGFGLRFGFYLDSRGWNPGDERLGWGRIKKA